MGNDGRDARQVGVERNRNRVNRGPHVPGMDEQQRVAAFVDQHGLEAPPAFRLLDLLSELGEVAKDVNESTGYGTEPETVAVSTDELGDTLFALLALAEALDVDAGEALDVALEKYERRLETGETPGSGE